MTTELEQQEQDLIPPAVRRRIEEMSKFTTPDPNAEPKDEVTPATPETPEPVPATVTPEPEPKKESATPPAEPTTLAEVATEEMTKEQRYKIMEGMQKSIGRELRQARAEAQALRDEVQALKTQTTARPAATTPPADPDLVGSGLEELKEAFGEKNLMEMVKFLRMQGFAVTQDLQQVQQQVGQVSQSMASSVTERFESEMDGYTNGRWRTTNVDPRFVKYSNEIEGRTGIPRLEFMKRYLAEQNAPMLAQFFVDFDAAVGDAVAPGAQPKVPALDKRKFAAPKATSTAAAPLSEDKPMVKFSEFGKLEADVRAGKYTSDDPEKQKTLQEKLVAEQARLNEAQRSGRMVQG